jgi:hypothetical protein
MTHTANHSVPEQGKIRRALKAAWAFLEAMESGSSGYMFDRIERLEREVGRLKEEIGQGGNSGVGDPHNPRTAALE